MKTSRYSSILGIIAVALIPANVIEAFHAQQPKQRLTGTSPPSSSPPPPASSSTLKYRVEESENALLKGPLSSLLQQKKQSQQPHDAPCPYFLTDITKHRDALKRELAIAAIENYNMEDFYNIKHAPQGKRNVAEDIMKRLESVNPWPRPAHHPELNARWSFVFTGVPTIGMRLITLLSRISVGVSTTIMDFQDVFLEVSHQNSQVKAIVSVQILGVPVELNVYTKLEPKTTATHHYQHEKTTAGTTTPVNHGCTNTLDPHGTFLVETFQKLVLAGVEIPTPDRWKTSRDLEITYLDQDMMIARTAGGEPHLLLRHSPCSTDDDTCDIDVEVTEYFQEARAKYGSTLSRCLVDRAYDADDDGSKRQPLDVDNIVRLIRAILEGKNGH